MTWLLLSIVIRATAATSIVCGVLAPCDLMWLVLAGFMFLFTWIQATIAIASDF